VGAADVDVPFGESVEQLVEGDTAFEPCKRGSEAEVDAVAKPEVLAEIPVDVETVGIRETAFVAVCGRNDEKQRAARFDGLAVKLDVFWEVTSDLRSGRLVAQ
jgi:hypothetical protein